MGEGVPFRWSRQQTKKKNVQETWEAPSFMGFYDIMMSAASKKIKG